MNKNEYSLLEGFFSDENLINDSFTFNNEDFSDKKE